MLLEELKIRVLRTLGTRKTYLTGNIMADMDGATYNYILIRAAKFSDTITCIAMDYSCTIGDYEDMLCERTFNLYSITIIRKEFRSFTMA